MAKSGKFIAGALIGAAAAALLTPIAGKKARKKIMDAAKSAGFDAEKIDEFAQSAKKIGQRIIKEATKQAPESKTKNKSKK